MWLLTTRGFYSAVAARDEPDTMIVRARVRLDLEALSPLVGDAPILEHAGSDYAYRVRVPRDTWSSAVDALTREIDYPNFKDAVRARQGYDRARLYQTIWSTLYSLQHRR
jgi:hypothetical protein